MKINVNEIDLTFPSLVFRSYLLLFIIFAIIKRKSHIIVFLFNIYNVISTLWMFM